MKKLKLISLILSLTAILSSHSLAEKEPNSNENIVPYYMQNANQHIHQNPNDNQVANQLNFLNQNNNQGNNQNNNQVANQLNFLNQNNNQGNNQNNNQVANQLNFLNQNINQGNNQNNNQGATQFNDFINGNNRGNDSLTNSQNNIPPSEYGDYGPVNPLFTMFPYILDIPAERFAGGANNRLYRLFKYIKDFRNGNRNDNTLADYMIPEEYLEEGSRNPIVQNIRNLLTLSVNYFVDGASNIYYKAIQYIKYLIYNQMINNQNNNQGNNQNNN